MSVDVSKCTKGPVAWAHIGEKTNGYVVGTICDEEGNALSGFVDWDQFVDEEILTCTPIGDKEASVCRYEDAELICEAFNVAAETGQSPRQLAERVKELESLCKELCDKAGDLSPRNTKRCLVYDDDGELIQRTCHTAGHNPPCELCKARSILAKEE
jgi:hypothetical protein